MPLGQLSLAENLVSHRNRVLFVLSDVQIISPSQILGEVWLDMKKIQSKAWNNKKVDEKLQERQRW